MTGLLRTLAGRVVLPVAALLVSFGVASAALPAQHRPPAPAASTVDTIGAEHDCQPIAGQGRTMLLIDSRPEGARLVRAATSSDGVKAQRDLFFDIGVDFYGWCRP